MESPMRSSKKTLFFTKGGHIFSLSPTSAIVPILLSYPHLREDLIKLNARKLDKARMIRFDERNGYLSATDLGRTSSHFYIRFETIEVFNEKFLASMTEADLFGLISLSTEFENIKVRDEELSELDRMLEETCVCQVKVRLRLFLYSSPFFLLSILYLLSLGRIRKRPWEGEHPSPKLHIPWLY